MQGYYKGIIYHMVANFQSKTLILILFLKCIFEVHNEHVEILATMCTCLSFMINTQTLSHGVHYGVY